MKKPYSAILLAGLVGFLTPPSAQAEPDSKAIVGSVVGSLSQVAAQLAQTSADPGWAKIDAINIIVKDIEKAKPAIEAVFGPMHPIEEFNTTVGVLHRGKPSLVRLKQATMDVGDLRVDITEVMRGTGNGNHSFLEFADKFGQGLQQFQFCMDDIEAGRKKLESIGYKTVSQAPPANLTWYYLEPPNGQENIFGGAVIELLNVKGCPAHPGGRGTRQPAPRK